MKLRFKIFFIFVVVTFLPISLGGLYFFNTVKSEFVIQTRDSLEGITSIQQQRVKNVLSVYLTQTHLIGSRLKLRRHLAAGDYLGNPAIQADISEILISARAGNTEIQTIDLYDTSFNLVPGSDNEGFITQHELKGQEVTTTIIRKVKTNEAGELTLEVVEPMVLDREVIGYVSVVFLASRLTAITSDYAGLGETGEVLLAQRTSAGDAQFIVPLRFDSSAALRRGVSQNTGLPVIYAINKQEVFLSNEDTVDYRSEPVFAYTRYIDGVEWGLVSKIDQKEVFEPIIFLRNIALFILILTYLIVTILWVGIANYFILNPIRRLTMFAQNIEKGNFLVRTNVKTNDEVGFLAKTMNGMAEKVQEYYVTLEKKVEERTQELERAEAESHAILANIAEGLVVYSPEKGFIVFNDQAHDILGRGPTDEAPETWPRIYGMYKKSTDEDVIRIEDFVLGKVMQGEVVVGETLYIKNKHIPEGKYIRLNGGPIHISGNITAVVFTFVDVTKEKEVDKAKTEFVSLASHQLKTPLTTINWYVEMLLDKDAGEINSLQTKYLDEVYEGSRRMVRLINSLLNVSRLELGTFSVEPQPVEMKEFIEGVVSENKKLIQEKKLSVNVVEKDEIPTVPVDTNLMQMILHNLVSNATKYTEPKGRIDISLSVKEENMIISVKDDGMGIPKKEQGKIFTKLFRAYNAMESDTDGTGLGLYVVKSVVEYVGGTIWFESEPEHGTVFYVSLPLSGMKPRGGTKKFEM